MRLHTTLICSLAVISASIHAQAPELQGIHSWIHSNPIQLKDLKGKVVLIDFWDYSCINCIRTLPHLNSWYKKYKDLGFIIIGVHTPEFAFEHNSTNVLAAVNRFGIEYPVCLDNDYKTWRAYNNKYWPTSYLIDKENNIILQHVGEGDYETLENAIRKQLNLPPLDTIRTNSVTQYRTPEIYLGFDRQEHYTPEITLIPNALTRYSYKNSPLKDSVGIYGTWHVSTECITAKGPDCFIELNFTGKKVHLVLSGASSQPIRLMLDGKELTKECYTEDMDSTGAIHIDGARKYDVVTLPEHSGPHLLKMYIPEGLSAYSFTFGSSDL